MHPEARRNCFAGASTCSAMAWAVSRDGTRMKPKQKTPTRWKPRGGWLWRG